MKHYCYKCKEEVKYIDSEFDDYNQIDYDMYYCDACKLFFTIITGQEITEFGQECLKQIGGK